jgi:hypothetical protein
MGVCDFLNSSKSREEAWQETIDFVNQMLENWGFEPVEWSDTVDPAVTDQPAYYDQLTNTIHIDVEHLPEIDDTDFPAVLNLGIHEAIHAAIFQSNFDMSDLDEEALAGKKGEEILIDLFQQCQDPTESGAPPNMPEFPFVSKEEN